MEFPRVELVIIKKETQAHALNYHVTTLIPMKEKSKVGRN